MATVHVYSRATPLHDVKGRVNYATSPDKQENLLAVAGQTDAAFWARLAEESQLAWRAAGGSKERVCCEAREICDALPNSALDGDLDALAGKIAARFKEKNGADCLVAIHLNKAKNNLHYHLIFSERQRLPEPVIRVADRAAFLDEAGVRRRTKKEILDADGQLRPGCSIIPKGEILSERHFGAKEDLFSSKGWLLDHKKDLADWINEELQPDKIRAVYDPRGPYLPQKKIKPGTPEEVAEDLRRYNALAKVFNQKVDAGELTEAAAKEIKAQVMVSPRRAEALEAAIWPKEATATLPGGERTKGGAKESQMRELRKMYRESNLAWARYHDLKKMDPNGIDTKTALGEARRVSMKINKLRKEMGLVTPDELVKELKKEEEARRRKRAWALQCRRRAVSWSERSLSAQRRIDYLYGEAAKIPLLFATEAEKRQREEIYKEIDRMKEWQMKCLMEERLERQRYRTAKKELREMRAQARDLRRESRQAARARKPQELEH